MLTMIDEMETAVSPNGSSNEPAAALWVCDACQVWWGSQNGPNREARHLLRLAEPNTTLFKWEDYRGWREQTATAHLCPECGHQAAHPRFSLMKQVNGRAAKTR